MDEKEYRQIVKKSFDALEKAFADVDPDKAEFEFSQGAVMITFSDRSKLILSQQPSVRQIWAAAASKGIAHHFNFDGSRWLDDKTGKIELLKFVSEVVRENTGIEIRP